MIYLSLSLWSTIKKKKTFLSAKEAIFEHLLFGMFKIMIYLPKPKFMMYLPKNPADKYFFSKTLFEFMIYLHFGSLNLWYTSFF